MSTQRLGGPRGKAKDPVNARAFIKIVIHIYAQMHSYIFLLGFRSRTGSSISVLSVSAGSESAVFLISIYTIYSWLSNTEILHIRTGTTCTQYILIPKSSL